MVPIDELMNLSTGELIEEIYIRDEMNDLLYKSIDKLDSLSRDVVLYRFKGELSFKDIGDILGKTENWARVTFFRGKAKIVKEMSQYE